jgi:hypothetical protein
MRVLRIALSRRTQKEGQMIIPVYIEVENRRAMIDRTYNAIDEHIQTIAGVKAIYQAPIIYDEQLEDIEIRVENK